MNWLRRFLDNHVLANLTFGLLLVLGVLSYLQMPRSRDPEVNFNWVNVLTVFPGASARDVELRITDPLEDAIRRSVRDIRFVTSTSRDGLSIILVRFNELDERTFDKRVVDVRREVQNTYTDRLPAEADDPAVYEITTSNGFPSATLVITGEGNDENLRRQARNIKKDMERLKGVDRAETVGLPDPELHVSFSPERLEGLGITPGDLATTVAAYFRDVSAGDIKTSDGNWIVRVAGTDSDPSALADQPVITASGVVPLGSLARLVRTTEEPSELVRYGGKPAVMVWVSKQADTNILQLIDDIRDYVQERNRLRDATGVTLTLVDDQTVSTREALTTMQTNALIGFMLVLLVTWIFLGTRISLVTSIGIPFTLAGTFVILYSWDFTLNNSVLLGVVISLGMLVDDAVVVVDAIYERLRAGAQAMDASIDALREVFAPVTTSVLTTISAFLPLMLLPGILGDFMKVIPLVVTTALLLSLIEAYWMLPAHITALDVRFSDRSRLFRMRQEFTHQLRLRYTRILTRALRHPWIATVFVLLLLVSAATVLATGHVRFNFFAGESLRLFYVNIEMPRGTSLERTLDKALVVEKAVLKTFRPGELRASATYSGQMFTEVEPLFSDNVGQVMFSLRPRQADGRTMEEIVAGVNALLPSLAGGAQLTMLEMKGGPPAAKPISVKVRGDEFGEIQRATNHLRDFLRADDRFSNVAQDYREGNPELVLQLDGEAIQRVGVDPNAINLALLAYVDGQLVTEFQDQGEEVKVRVKAQNEGWTDIQDLLRQTLAVPGAGSVPLGELVHAEPGTGQQNIRHYGFRRTITLEADIDKERIDTVAANKLIEEEWDRVRQEYPTIDLDFTGELDDIQESIDSIAILFLLGIGLIYLILGTQFRSYFQPLMILVTVPLAFAGVVLGLLVTGYPLSLFTLYGVVALAGVSVNSAIVLISAANDRLEAGMSLLHATIYAARRRVVPILITSLTTIAGLFSLATGLGGSSRMWGPVATAIVWGLAFSTVLTLIVIPLLYRGFMGRSRLLRQAARSLP